MSAFIATLHSRVPCVARDPNFALPTPHVEKKQSSQICYPPCHAIIRPIASSIILRDMPREDRRVLESSFSMPKERGGLRRHPGRVPERRYLLYRVINPHGVAAKDPAHLSLQHYDLLLPVSVDSSETADFYSERCPRVMAKGEVGPASGNRRAGF